MTHRFEKITCKVFLIETDEEPEHTEPMEMSEWIKIKINDLENFYTTPTIEKNKELILKKLKENFTNSLTS